LTSAATRAGDFHGRQRLPDAARNLKKKMCEALAKRWAVPVEELEARGGRIHHRNGTGKSASFDEAAAISIQEFGALEATGTTRRRRSAGREVQRRGVGPSPSYSYSAQAVEVTVDPETGEVKVDRITVAHDCGRA
jgi:4-hydroxybenzoyl-CoA reductase subunit alpha